MPTASRTSGASTSASDPPPPQPATAALPKGGAVWRLGGLKEAALPAGLVPNAGRQGTPGRGCECALEQRLHAAQEDGLRVRAAGSADAAGAGEGGDAVRERPDLAGHRAHV